MQDASIVTSTLAQVVVLVGGLWCVSWWLLGVPGRLSRRAALWFAAANLLLVAAITLTLGRGTAFSVPAYWLHYWVADLLGLAGIAALRSGVRQLLRLPPAWRESLLLLVLAGGAMALIPYPEPDIRVRGVLFSVAALWLLIRLTVDCLRAMHGPLPRLPWLPLLIVAMVFASIGLMMLLRALGLAFRPETVLPMESTVVGTSIPMLWATLLQILLINASLVGLVVMRLVQRISHLATHDPLTGCLNRRAMDERVRSEQARNRRSGESFGLVMFDLDEFKRINDGHGHLAGDEALRHVVAVVRGQLREIDLVARWGGEEFLVLLPGSDLQATHAAARRMQAALVSSQWGWQDYETTLTASFSVVAVAGGPLDFPALDRALYRAKELGRNRIETA